MILICTEVDSLAIKFTIRKVDFADVIDFQDAIHEAKEKYNCTYK